MEWAITQVVTARDYCHDSWFWTYLGGALNFQIAHHLMPGVSQEHYPALNQFVASTCKEFGIPYSVLPSASVALREHFRQLFKLGHNQLANKEE
eukprot:TRINITY_DN1703_c0_g1_i1.p1 TRINITY_DN1703_c0_g1~~TRINITY_DN1703_c0_g1_i1.p1  ORF type:complete len:94 (+),score=30.03 TRINITY_DN1703_c0_g1_i1:127-408(+)